MQKLAMVRFHHLPPVSAGVAQLVERRYCKANVAGSIPAAGTIRQ